MAHKKKKEVQIPVTEEYLKEQISKSEDLIYYSP
jgi:hypothetical protein